MARGKGATLKGGKKCGQNGSLERGGNPIEIEAEKGKGFAKGRPGSCVPSINPGTRARERMVCRE